MTDLKNIIDDPNYDAHATVASKSTIFTFIATYAYLVFYEGYSPGFIGGGAFFIIGMFVVSLVISMPLFFLGLKFKKLSPIISLVDIGATVALTWFAFIWLFPPAAVSAQFPFTVNCPNDLPEFTLGYDSNPTKDQVNSLCSCIWNDLTEDNKKTSILFSSGNLDKVEANKFKEFTANFNNSVTKCGGNKL